VNIRNLVPLLALLALIECDKTPTGEASGQPNDLVAYTDAVSYVLEGGYVQVSLHVENWTDSTSYFPFCGPRYVTFIQRSVNAVWENWRSWMICAAIYQAGVDSLEPCSLHTDVFTFDQPGTYRFLLPHQWDPQLTQWTDSLFSNEFAVN
jgi:hypothetical protein